jgi:hypothetical protein
MKNNRGLGRAIFIIFSVVSLAEASNVGGTSGAEVLNIPVGARAIGMGEAFTAMADDVSSLYWNPSGIALLNQSQASFMYSQWLQGLSYHNASVATPLEYGGLGASLSYLSYGDIQGFDNQGNAQGSVNAYNAVATVGGGLMGDFWAAGFTVKGIQSALADEKATAFASDFGATYIHPKEMLGGTLRAAATFRNLGTGLKFIDQKDPLPREWRVGLAAIEMARRRLNLSLDYGQQRDLDGALYAGAEFWALPNVALRAGYAGSDNESNGIRAGLGLKLKNFSFDYAFSPYGDLGMTHRYELTMRFGAIRPLLTAEMRRMLRQAKLAMADGRYGEATMLLDSLIRMEPRYKTFHRMIKIAMNGYESHEKLAKNGKGLDWALLSGKKQTKEDNYEIQELEALLKMSDEAERNALAPVANTSATR